MRGNLSAHLRYVFFDAGSVVSYPFRANSYEINNKKEYKTVIMRSFVIRL